jgi:hypothetical protein
MQKKEKLRLNQQLSSVEVGDFHSDFIQYGAMTEAAERLIAQLYSQSKLTMPRGEILKIRHEN